MGVCRGHHSRLWHSRRAVRAYIRSLKERRIEASCGWLDEYDQETFDLILAGKSRKEIAEAIELSEYSAKYRIERLYRWLGLPKLGHRVAQSKRVSLLRTIAKQRGVNLL
jgi:DNA-binding NarL/FixJ family response regulator